ncbi:MAG: NADH-quinone oxidoreductase subunit NuoG [Actinobacteria bacterium]|nr:NADH-quinone oxidoreductase subunit NuoG [Actinomycetota bacterium]
MSAVDPQSGAGPELVTVTIDGREFRVEAGRNMLDVALSLGFDLPFFCWHPLMGSIGACRQCAVRLFWTGRDGGEKSEIAMACMTEAQEGTRIVVVDEEAVRFRARMIELMMMSHPHDCPVCDEGGECHLQDMTVMTGHAYRRYRGLKRTFRNQDLGPFVTHELNRCITCYRCTRLYNDYAGGHDFGVFGLRNQVYFGRETDGTLQSEFSGNLIEVCPTGVFDDKTLTHHYARKWDLQTAPAVCPHCGLGCNTTPGARYGELRRVLSRYNRDINKMFLCDRGRFGSAFVNAPQRIRASKVAWRPVSMTADARQAPVAVRRERALDAAASLLRGRRVLGIGSPRVSLEANYALRTLVGADRFYLGMSDTDYDLVGAVLEIARAGITRLGALADVQHADAVFILGEDVTNTAPMLDLTVRTWLRLRPTAAEERVHIRRWNDAAIGRAKRREPSPLWIATSHATKLDEVAGETWRAAPADIARLALAAAHELDPAAAEVADLRDDERERVGRWAGALRAGRRPLIVCGAANGSPALLRAAATLAATSGSALLLTVPEPNSLGLRLIGGGRLPQAIAAVARGEADAVVTLDNDLHRRAASLLVDDLFAHEAHVVALAALEGRLTERADVVLPAPTFAESTGTFVNHEGRAQRSFSVLAPEGETQEEWRWIRDLMERLSRQGGRGWRDVDDVTAALEMELPQLRGVVAAAPSSDWRRASRKVARQPQRWSGRTAADADVTVHEPAPVPDPDSALTYSLEGLTPGESPAALQPRVWSAGWNSGNGLHKLQEEVGGPLRGGPTGVRLLDGRGRARPLPAPPAPPAFLARDDDFVLVPLHHIFGSDDLSMHTPGIAERAPQPYIAVNREDAQRLELTEGDRLELWMPWLDVRVPFRLEPSLPTGVAGVPVGLAGMPYVPLPGHGRLTRIPASPALPEGRS